MIKASPKQKKILQLACDKPGVDIKYKSPILDCETRWNSKEAMIERFVYLQPALEALDVKNAFENPKKQRNW